MKTPLQTEIDELRGTLVEDYGFDLPVDHHAMSDALERELENPPRNCASLLQELYDLLN